MLKFKKGDFMINNENYFKVINLYKKFNVNNKSINNKLQMVRKFVKIQIFIGF